MLHDVGKIWLREEVQVDLVTFNVFHDISDTTALQPRTEHICGTKLGIKSATRELGLKLAHQQTCIMLKQQKHTKINGFFVFHSAGVCKS